MEAGAGAGQQLGQVEELEVAPSRGGFAGGVSEMPRQSTANRGDDGFNHMSSIQSSTSVLPVRQFYFEERRSSHIPDSYLCLKLF